MNHFLLLGGADVLSAQRQCMTSSGLRVVTRVLMLHFNHGAEHNVVSSVTQHCTAATQLICINTVSTAIRGLNHDSAFVNMDAYVCDVSLTVMKGPR